MTPCYTCGAEFDRSNPRIVIRVRDPLSKGGILVLTFSIGYRADVTPHIPEGYAHAYDVDVCPTCARDVLSEASHRSPQVLP